MYAFNLIKQHLKKKNDSCRLAIINDFRQISSYKNARINFILFKIRVYIFSLNILIILLFNLI